LTPVEHQPAIHLVIASVQAVGITVRLAPVQTARAQ
jgi:hypothetical protein